jgi:hypothetical protein
MSGDGVDESVFKIGMKWTEDSLHGFVSTVETHTGQNQYEIAVGDWQGMDCVPRWESEIGRKVRKELIGS